MDISMNGMENQTQPVLVQPPAVGVGSSRSEEAERQGAWQYIGWLVIGVAFTLLGLLLATYRYLREQQIRLHMRRLKKDATSPTPRTRTEDDDSVSVKLGLSLSAGLFVMVLVGIICITYAEQKITKGDR